MVTRASGAANPNNTHMDERDLDREANKKGEEAAAASAQAGGQAATTTTTTNNNKPAPVVGFTPELPVSQDPREQSILRFMEFNSASNKEFTDWLLDGNIANRNVSYIIGLDADHISMLLDKLMLTAGDDSELAMNAYALAGIIEALEKSPKFLDVMSDEMKGQLLDFAAQVDAAHPNMNMSVRLQTAITNGEAYSELNGYEKTPTGPQTSDLFRTPSGDAPKSFDGVMAMLIDRMASLEQDNDWTLSKLAEGGDYSESAITAAKAQFDKNSSMLGVLRGMASALSDFEREKSRIWG
ncbi:MAG: hypothetical protein H6730_37495 [Deltaproteobacteria bacterium]|nr:hypothetical protein [Deltaproteobacteria bacterium]